MPPKMKFSEEEKVLCFHGPLLYEAKCIRGELKDKAFRYFVHYNGWNKNWDEWVPESRILKFTEASLQKQKELQKAHAVKNKASKAGRISEKDKDKEKDKEKDKDHSKDKDHQRDKEKEDTADGTKGRVIKSQHTSVKDKKIDKEKDRDRDKSRQGTPSIDCKKFAPSSLASAEHNSTDKLCDNMPLSELMKKKRTRQSDVISNDSPTINESATMSSAEPPKKKRARVDPTVESREMFLTKIEVRIKIPDELKPWLVDDWDLVTRQKQLVCLPCKMTVENILDEYVKTKLAKLNQTKDAIIEVTQGIKEYFNVMLGAQLLYKFERQQYAEMLLKYPELPVSQVYGATHLLRLFVKLGGMLAYTPLDEKSLHLLLNHLHDFLKYMARSASNLFSISDYTVAPPDYHRKAI